MSMDEFDMDEFENEIDGDGAHSHAVEDMGSVEAAVTGGGLSLAERAERIRAGAAEAQEEVFPLGPYGEILKVRYRTVGWKEVTRIRKLTSKVRDEASRDIVMACEILIAAAKDVIEVRENGEEVPLGIGLGRDLAEKLSLLEQLPRGATDRQALIRIFTSYDAESGTFKLVSHFEEVWTWMTSVSGELDGSVEELFTGTD